jgi:hypothetical protein
MQQLSCGGKNQYHTLWRESSLFALSFSMFAYIFSYTKQYPRFLSRHHNYGVAFNGWEGGNQAGPKAASTMKKGSPSRWQ